MATQLQEPAAVSASSPEDVRPLTGNEAMARAAWEAGVRVAAAYPGTPSTEILESLAHYPAEDVVAQWAPNEKVSLDVAIGASFAGVRAFCAMKHVGLNVAADSLMTQGYLGVNAGLVLAVADDPGIHSSQTEQDTRLYAQLANVPVLEPSDAQEALDFIKAAFDISEQFDTPVIVRSTTRICHTRSAVRTGPRQEVAPRPFREDTGKNVSLPTTARKRRPLIIEREKILGAWLGSSPMTRWEKRSKAIGIITTSIAYNYVREAMPEASVLKLAGSFPLATDLVREFSASVERVLVVEELEPFIEMRVRALGIDAGGKEFFPQAGELSAELVRRGLAKAGLLPMPKDLTPITFETVVRPPVLCAGCPHIGSYLPLRAIDARVCGDIGCYTLSAIEPLRAMDTCVAMGSSIAVATGFALSGTQTRPVIATIGDSTFIHSGLPPLIDAVYNKANMTVMILDNQITAMTGGQDHPGTGRTLRGEVTHKVNYEAVCRAFGVEWIRTVDPYDLGALHRTVREATEQPGVSVIITSRPCVLDPVKITGIPFSVKAESCVACQSCMNLGCPAISWSDEMHDGHHKVQIDQANCIGCSLCMQVCPSDGIVMGTEVKS